MQQQEKFDLNRRSTPYGVQHPDTFTMAEFIKREQDNERKGKKSLFYLLIVLTLLWAIIKLPYTIIVSIQKWFKNKR